MFYALPANAATVTWTGGGSDDLASNPANWSSNAIPQYGNNVVFNGTSKDCTWDLDVTLASLDISSGYSGRITKISGVSLTIAKSFVPPDSPSGLSAAAISSNQIDLAWTDNSNNEAGFKIERKTGIDGTYSQVAIVGAGIINYSDTGLTAGTNYDYRIRAYNSLGDSAYSNEYSAATLSPPSITINPTTNLNGNSATLSATVNPNGSDTTVYFECGTGTSYNINYTPQSIGNGTSDVNVTANITNLLPNTGYHCRVVVINPYGTFYGNDVNFTTPPITLTIISPVNDSTINRPDVMVRGTVANTTGNETGVTVNGLIGTVYNNEFVVNHVPLTEGSNTITVIATDTAGKTATTSITVNAVTTSPHVSLRANIESGIAPLTTYFSVLTSMPNAVSTFQMDFEGNGIIDYTGTTFDNIRFAYDTEGIYFPTITVTDDQSNTYTDTIAVVVLNRTDIDALLKGKWNAMKTALANRNVEDAVGYFIDRSRERYRTIFGALRDQLPVITGTFVEFGIVDVYDNIAEYEVVANENGVLHSYPGVFIKDSNGIWKFKDF